MKIFSFQPTSLIGQVEMREVAGSRVVKYFLMKKIHIGKKVPKLSLILKTAKTS